MSSGIAGAGSRVVVVSNRLPLTLKRSGDGWRTERSTGGLATAMGPILARSRGVWIGWSGAASGSTDDKRQKLLARGGAHATIAVDLSPTRRGALEGFFQPTLVPCSPFPL